jgi:hypothetical protein
MADINKAITSPTKSNAKAAKVKEEGLDAAAKKLKRNSSTVKQKREKLAEGDAGLVPYAFFYADGRVKSIRTKAKNVRTMLLPVAADGAVHSNGKRLVATRYDLGTKPFKVSYGRKSVTIKGKKKLVQAWVTLPAPKDATFMDIAHAARSFKKVPAIVRYGLQDLILDGKKARAGAGGVR